MANTPSRLRQLPGGYNRRMHSHDLKVKAESLAALHHTGRILILPNAWDVASACLLESLGFPAVATSSAAIANMLGYPDGQRISRQEMLAAVGRIASAISVPVTADLEAGYASNAEEMSETARQLLEAGAVGLNLEDSMANETQLIDVAIQLHKIRAVREVGLGTGVPIVLNARTDVYFVKGGDPATRMQETVRRANAYRQAGADCIFVPGLKDPADIQRFLRESPGPLNILAGAGVPPLAELQKLGVARLSVGSGPYRATLGLFRRIALELRESGTYTQILQNAIPYDEVNALLS